MFGASCGSSQLLVNSSRLLWYFGHALLIIPACSLLPSMRSMIEGDCLSWPGGLATSCSYGRVLSKFSIIYCLFYYQPFQCQRQPSGCQPPQHQNSESRPYPNCIDTNTIPTVLTRRRRSTPVPPLVLSDQVASSENIHVLHHLAMKQTPYEMPNHTYREVCPCISLDVPIP